MIRLGLRLTLGSGREAALRVLVTAAAVALGVGLLLACLAAVNGLHAQTDRGAWLDTSAQASRPTSTSGELWWLSSTDEFGNQEIDRVDVAAAGSHAPVPPGIPHLPGPGEYYASPALTTLLRSEPPNELRDRYSGRQIGTVGAGALPSPKSPSSSSLATPLASFRKHPVRSRSELSNARRLTAMPARIPSAAGPFCSSSWPAEPSCSCCRC